MVTDNVMMDQPESSDITQNGSESNDADYSDDEYPTAGVAMSEKAQKERRNSIREIMADDSMTPLEKRRNIQFLMDGRRRSSLSHGSTASSVSSAGDAAENYQFDNEDNYSHHSHHSHHSSGNNNMAENDYCGYQDDSSSTREAQPPQNPQGINHSTNAMINERILQLSQDVSAGGGRKQRSSSMPLWSEDTSRAAAPLVAASSNAIWDDPINISTRMEKSRPPCNHYERNCTIISPCCGLAFGCRICHDECPVLPMPFARRPPPATLPTTTSHANASSGGEGGESVDGMVTTDAGEGPSSSSTTAAAIAMPQERILNWEAVERAKHKQEKRRSMPLSYDEYNAGDETHHEIDRFSIAEIICRLCHTRQSSKTNFCTSCGAQFGAYHCDICNLWMADDEYPYHCESCGFCRVGGRENFRHCDDCGMCIDTLLFDDHNCKAGKYMSNCPVCQEDLFSSRDASHEMPCGHAIHWHCFRELTSYDTRCPVCKKTAETPEHMAPTWQAMAMGIALQPVPPELARVVTILCADCEEKDENRRWHFLGVRCMHCMSFNTTVERTTLMGREAAVYLDEMEKANREATGCGTGIRPMDAS